jgi:hypothetical protein
MLIDFATWSTMNWALALRTIVPSGSTTWKVYPDVSSWIYPRFIVFGEGVDDRILKIKVRIRGMGVEPAARQGLNESGSGSSPHRAAAHFMPSLEHGCFQSCSCQVTGMIVMMSSHHHCIAFASA